MVLLPSLGPGIGVTYEELTVLISMANGGVNYKDGILLCAQSSMDAPVDYTICPPTRHIQRPS
jgi:gluconolactonase